MLPQWKIAKARSHPLSLDPLSTALHSHAQPYTAIHSHAQPWTPNYLLCRILWHVIITLACDYYFGMWFSALVIFPLEVTNSGHHGNQEWLIHLRFHPKVITNHSKAYKSPHIHYQSPHFYYQSPRTLLPITPNGLPIRIFLSNRRALCRV